MSAEKNIEAVVEGAFTAACVIALALAAFLLLSLTGCDPVVASKQIGQPETRSYSDTEYGPGYCATFMPGFDGNNDYTFKFSPYCPHEVTKDGTFVRVEQTHKSGVIDTVWSGPQ